MRAEGLGDHVCIDAQPSGSEVEGEARYPYAGCKPQADSKVAAKAPGRRPTRVPDGYPCRDERKMKRKQCRDYAEDDSRPIERITDPAKDGPRPAKGLESSIGQIRGLFVVSFPARSMIA